MSLPSVIALGDQALAIAVKRRAQELGFDLAGVAPAGPSVHQAHLRRWLDEGRAGTMNYLANRFNERTDPAVYLPGARSVVCVAMNYHVPLQPVPEADQAQHGRIAKYALGQDYHEVMKSRLYTLADWIRAAVPGAETRCGVDTAPILERELAARAGIGWVGKNTCIIHPRIGSWLLLGEIITTVELPADEPVADHCGSCTRCLDACPTEALTAPYQLDARKCISYLTIEHRGEIAESLRAKMGDWLYGCDVCQDVCPHNHAAPPATDSALTPRFPTGTLNLDDVSTWTPEDYRTRLRHSAMKRVKLPQLQYNARIVSENTASSRETRTRAGAAFVESAGSIETK